ncbi:MAG: 4-hydroxyphenylacetate 3-monooxygenase, oxygenase component [Rhodospirillaceae bacterium]|jgi:4-hydroxyphenylacetate 3-monooxygenase|nr:4-hydroxyphenylacetate 3-monooxygenase, oxygenase component [Rhodospirillaceae bacterium]MBT3885245.1 4-hydroxyphenylacetate 3-monooxygenase, oxygenase component [Rhodospirillaceae bacterium]MBT4115709.1 4-hydroxyphenylacetate 3-monooxygenase, oxygenase component [Rhodospirillaceae bacterium]MBT4673396.1 4-hydroxyphenylacetate 3-monooxygenase, oxygenase component [Rhodospirillaceae bacterium]MBT4719747.1 4-hydroxyphenylacetate 3-monooxygenase, oxygenase component [Rhodospirillaceae bacterium
MPIRTAAQYLDGLRDDRHIQIDGERITDVTADRRFRLAAETMAGLLAMQHDTKLAPQLTYTSPSSGDAVGMTHLQPKSKDDLVARNDAIKIWMDETCGMLGRSPDYKNVMWSAYAAAANIFDRDSFKGADNVRNYHEYVRENDLVMTHVLVNPQVDRSKPAHLQESDITAHITKETDAGIVINGARMVATLCALADEIVVMPAAVRWQGTETIDTTDYSFGFAIPTATPGLKFVCRPSFADMHSSQVLDYPFSARYDESDGLAIFEDVFVPWEKVFIHRDPEFDGEVTAAGQIYPHMVMQSVVRAASKAEFMMALTFALARTTKIDQHNPVQLLLAETMGIAEFCRTCRIAAEAEAFETEHGIYSPGTRSLQVWQSMFWKMYVRQCEIITTLGAGGLVAAPSMAELAGEMKDSVETYFQSVNADAKSRTMLLRLAYDAALSGFSGRQKLYEQYYLGDPNRTQSMWYRSYNVDDHIERIWTMLDDLEKRYG